MKTTDDNTDPVKIEEILPSTIEGPDGKPIPVIGKDEFGNYILQLEDNNIGINGPKGPIPAIYSETRKSFEFELNEKTGYELPKGYAYTRDNYHN